MRPGATARVATMDAVVELPCGNTCPRSIGRLAPLRTQGTSRPKSLPQSTRWWTRSLAGWIAPPRNRSIHGTGWKLPVGFRAGWFQGAGRTEELDLGVGADASMRSVGRKSFVWCRDRPGDADSRLWPGGSHRGIRCGLQCGVVFPGPGMGAQVRPNGPMASRTRSRNVSGTTALKLRQRFAGRGPMVRTRWVIKTRRPRNRHHPGFGAVACVPFCVSKGMERVHQSASKDGLPGKWRPMGRLPERKEVVPVQGR